MRHVVLRFATLASLIFGFSFFEARAAEATVAGVAVHISSFTKESFRPLVLRQLDLAKSLGITVIRWDAPWKQVEEVKGRLSIPVMWDFAVDEARKRGIESILILDYGNQFYGSGLRPRSFYELEAFKRYAEHVVTHFDGRVRFYELWNEWDQGNAGSGAGTAREYVDFISTIYPHLKARSPHSYFLAGGVSREGLESLLSPWSLRESHHFFERSLDLGMLRFADGISIHPYSREAPSVKEKLSTLNVLIKSVDQKLREHNGGAMFPIYITEIGWPTMPDGVGRTVSYAEQSELVLGSYELAAAFESVKAIVFYQLYDGAAKGKVSSSAYSYGLVEGGAGSDSFKPAYLELRKTLSR